MVSIIIPTYNYGHFIAEALSSVKSQTYQEFECLIIDNGSTDNTAEIVKPFLTDNRFRYYAQTNQGVASARNKGLRESRGEYILFLDADDLIEKEKLKISAQFLDQHPEYDLVYSDMRYFRSGNSSGLYYSFACDKTSDRPWMAYISGKGKPLVNVLLDGNILPISSPVTRKHVLEEVSYFDEELHYNEDWDLWLRLALNGCSFYYLDEPCTMTLIRIHQNSASRDFFKMQCSGLKVLRKNVTQMNSMGLTEKVKTRMSDHVKLLRSGLLDSTGATFDKRIQTLRAEGLFTTLFRFDLPSVFLKKLFLRFFRKGVLNV